MADSRDDASDQLKQWRSQRGSQVPPGARGLRPSGPRSPPGTLRGNGPARGGDDGPAGGVAPLERPGGAGEPGAGARRARGLPPWSLTRPHGNSGCPAERSVARPGKPEWGRRARSDTGGERCPVRSPPGAGTGFVCARAGRSLSREFYFILFSISNRVFPFSVLLSHR